MDVHQTYLLAGDVVFIAPENLSANDRQHLFVTDTDVVITYKNSRKRSKVVTKELADLLQHFSSPQTVVNAIFHYAVQTTQDPQMLAEAAFPILVNMQQEGYLVRPPEGAAKAEAERFVAGDQFGSYVVTDICQQYENNAVYRAVDQAGTPFALKVFTASAISHPPPDYATEVAVLQQLDNVINPALCAYGEHNGYYYLATQWCDGAPCEAVAKQYRNFLTASNVLALLELCAAIATAYHHLHEQGILHGDIHPANILIGRGNTVSIIDYGNAVERGGSQRTIRGGIDFYYEPELAKALLFDKGPVPITKKGEQYALAVLLYHLFTGHHYLSFSYETEAAYRQIAEEPPLPFSTFSLVVPAGVEAVFHRALAKDPDERYPSILNFAEALQESQFLTEKSRLFFVGGKHDGGEKLVRFLVRRYGLNGPLMQDGLQLPPTSSVNNGAAGIAWFLYRAACVFEEGEWLDAAAVWSARATAYADDFDKAFYSAGDGITRESVGRRSLYHSPTGVHLVQATVSRARGDGYALQMALQQYLLTARTPCHQLDLTLGKAGLLIGSTLLLHECQAVNGMPTGPLVAFTNTLLQALWQQLSQLSSMEKEKEVGHYGIAHGWGGLLYATLFWCAASGQSLPPQAAARLEELLAKGMEQNGVMRWPVSNGEHGNWTGWCHGNAGHVFLWSEAFRYFGDERFRTTALQTGAALFQQGPQTPNLCCGLAGEAYALLHLFQLTGEQKYREAAIQRGQRILRDLSSPDLRNHSLYKGEVGMAVLLCELTRPDRARMPLFA